MKLLLTAFDPFGGEKTNPAEQAVSLIGNSIMGVEIIKLTVPTVFEDASRCVMNAVEKHRPSAVIMFGQAGGRCAITPERVAINIMDATIADNAGNMPKDEPVIPGAPAAYFSTLPIKAIEAAIRARGIPASVSNSAGTFVCNALMYGVLHELNSRFPDTVGGFIHVPFSPAQAIGKAAPSMSISDIKTGIEAATEATIEYLDSINKKERNYGKVQ